MFIDASPERCQKRGQHSHLSASCGPRVNENSLNKYIPQALWLADPDEKEYTLDLIGARLLLYSLTDCTTIVWRL